MSLGSTVSFVWGVQVETVPLLLGSQCYESYHQAEIFFALLSLRIRTNTLRLELNSSSSLLPPPSLASLPPEVTDMILDELFGTLYSDRRTALIKRLGTCCCSFERKSAAGGNQDEGEHECGIDCSRWPDCCSQMEGPPDTIWHREHDCTTVINSRLQFWDDRGNGSPPKELSRTLHLFHLNLITLPTCDDVFHRGPNLPLSVVGLPAAPSASPSLHPSHGYVTPFCAQLHQSHIEVQEEEDPQKTAVISLPSFRALSLKQSKSFSRFLRVTRLEPAHFEKDLIAMKGPVEEDDSKQVGEGRKLGNEEVGASQEIAKDEPSILLLHRVWCS